MSSFDITKSHNLAIDYLKSKNTGYKELEFGYVRNGCIRIAYSIFSITNKQGKLIKSAIMTIADDNKILGRDLLWNERGFGLCTLPTYWEVYECSDVNEFNEILDLIISELIVDEVDLRELSNAIREFSEEGIYEQLYHYENNQN